MERNQVYNFSAGPSVMAEPVLRRAQAELMNFGGSGMSVMEMSHRSAQYAAIFAQTKEKLIRALDVPDTHAVLFLQGGASTQFSMVPLNLSHAHSPAGGALFFRSRCLFSLLRQQHDLRNGMAVCAAHRRAAGL